MDNDPAQIPTSEDPRIVLRWALDQFGDEIALVSSLGPQSLVILDMIHELGRRVPVIMIDTGFLFAETHQLRARVEDHFDIDVIRIRPPRFADEGERPWSRNPDLCCRRRKVDRLHEVLSDYEAWISGIRRDQSPARARSKAIEPSSRFGLTKINPLVTWTREMVWEHLRIRGVPYNPLLDRDYASVGCWPCTSPVMPGEDERAGRWQGRGKTECGLHLSDDAGAEDVEGDATPFSFKFGG